MSAHVASATFTAKLIRREKVADGTMAFHFEKPAGYSFVPGQFLELTLLDPPQTDAEGNTRAFSIASAPKEASLMVATRLRDSALKRSLRDLPLETEVRIEGPFGGLRLPSNLSRTAVLLAGGIGITPFRSMVLHATGAGLALPIVLFYASRRPEDAAFLTELQACQRRNARLDVIACMSAMESSQSEWPGERGTIDERLLAKYLDRRTLGSPIYYVAGPPAMVQATSALLNARGVDADDMRLEEFAGY